MVEEATAAAPGRAGYRVPIAHELCAEKWPAYRLRSSVVAQRLSGPMAVGGRLYRDGYLVRDDCGHVVVMAVADFEAVYEPDD